MSSASDKNRFIVIEKKSKTRDASGADKPNAFSERCRVWASRLQKSGTESNTKHELAATQEVEWCIWFRTDIERTDRIYFEGVYHEILDIREEGFRAELKLITRAVRP